MVRELHTHQQTIIQEACEVQFGVLTDCYFEEFEPHIKKIADKYGVAEFDLKETYKEFVGDFKKLQDNPGMIAECSPDIIEIIQLILELKKSVWGYRYPVAYTALKKYINQLRQEHETTFHPRLN